MAGCLAQRNQFVLSLLKSVIRSTGQTSMNQQQLKVCTIAHKSFHQRASLEYPVGSAIVSNLGLSKTCWVNEYQAHHFI
jgi:hypothetical protein